VSDLKTNEVLQKEIDGHWRSSWSLKVPGYITAGITVAGGLSEIEPHNYSDGRTVLVGLGTVLSIALFRTASGHRLKAIGKEMEIEHREWIEARSAEVAPADQQPPVQK
jgi:hypothetical protein